MMDLPTIIADATAFTQECQDIILGLENMMNANLTQDEKNTLSTLRDQYIILRDNAQRLAAQAQALLDLGYPNLPKITIDAEFKTKLETGITVEETALGLMTGVEKVVGGTLNLGAGVEKKWSEVLWGMVVVLLWFVAVVFLALVGVLLWDQWKARRMKRQWYEEDRGPPDG